MEIGNQIKSFRLRRGITQEAMAQHFGITPQAVSKWERGAATPDITMLPDISAYFGVTIDELFALSDDTRMERIQNMIWDVRFIPESDVEAARDFLLEKARREGGNGRPLELLADLENHLADEHHERAAEYAREALLRDPTVNAHGELIQAMNGECEDWNLSTHYRLIDFYQSYIQNHPTCKNAYLSILDQLIADYRLEEAETYLQQFAQIDSSYCIPLYRGKIAWKRGAWDSAFAIWAQMEQDFPDEWRVYHNIGDYMTRAGKNESAETYYQKAIAVQSVPRYADPFEALAQFYERTGDYRAAIETLQDELEVFEKEWHFSTGECVDYVRREIARLERKL